MGLGRPHVIMVRCSATVFIESDLNPVVLCDQARSFLSRRSPIGNEHSSGWVVGTTIHRVLRRFSPSQLSDGEKALVLHAWREWSRAESTSEAPTRVLERGLPDARVESLGERKGIPAAGMSHPDFRRSL